MANLSFGLSLGSTAEERLIYAIASVAADVVKITAVIVVIRLWQKPQRMLACVGAVLGLICLAWSLASAAGFALSTRDHIAAVHAAASQVNNGWTTTIRRAGEQLALVGQSRPPTVIEAELAGQMVPAAIWKRTRECVELTLPESRDACSRTLALRQELAAAQSAHALEERIAEARRELATKPAVGQSADPQVVGLAAMVGIEEATLRRSLALLLAVLVEVGSAFGFALAHAATASPPPPLRSHAPPRTGATPQTGKAPKNAPRNSAPSAVVSFAEQAARLKRGRRPTTDPDQSLARWTEECVQWDHHGCVGARTAYEAYCRWAENVGITAVTETKFGRSLTARITAMGGSKTKRREGSVYLGIRIVGAPVPKAKMAA
ncbi:MAG: hypothetical protein ACKVP3_14955 [Hyphomicrobiaceae bacterium]